MYKIYKHFSDWFAIKITNSLSTMECAWLFFLWSLLPLRFPQMQNVVQYVSQSVIQLVALSLVMVAQKIQQQNLNDLHDKHDDLHEKLDKLISNQDE
jgi:hypothetical protein